MGDYPVELIEGEIKTTKWKWNNESMYFGASWHQYTRIETGDSIKNMDGQGNPFDINYTKLEGEGIYVEDVLVLFNTEPTWWGEGDEKV